MFAMAKMLKPIIYEVTIPKSYPYVDIYLGNPFVVTPSGVIMKSPFDQLRAASYGHTTNGGIVSGRVCKIFFCTPRVISTGVRRRRT